jgi:exopolyphosphatase/guanosine-5'-triphosphate,3'-diphosphate pyrophosphatase
MHRHSAYILQNSDLPGFNQEQQMLMATLVRYHRKAIKLDDLPRFTLFRKKQFLPLIQLLRLGVLLNNQRQATTTPPTLRLQTEAHHWTLTFPHNWFSQNALVLLDLEKEQQYWEGVPEWLLKKSQTPDRLYGYHASRAIAPGFLRLQALIPPPAAPEAPGRRYHSPAYNRSPAR